MKMILHSDMNNFYASVECLFHPEIRNKPVAVCGDVENRHGIVLAKNNIAKAYGVKTGNAIWEAQAACPDLVVVPPHYDRYLQYSRMAREIYADYTDQIEPFGLDENWLDVSGSTTLCGDGEKIAGELRQRVKDELGVTVSVGVSYNKIFAKLGSDMKKPDATTVIPPDGYREKVWPLPVEDLLYVGPATARKLHKYGVHTIGQLAQLDREYPQSWLGKIGVMLWSFANGLDSSPVSGQDAKPIIKSVGNSTTAPRDLVTDDDVKITMYALAESVSSRMRDLGVRCKTVQISLRDNELSHYERQAALPVPGNSTMAIFEAAFELYQTRRLNDKPLRSVGVRGCNLVAMDDMQLSLYEHVRRLQRQETLDVALDDIRRRFGYEAVQRGIMLADPALNLDAKGEHVIHPVAFLQ